MSLQNASRVVPSPSHVVHSSAVHARSALTSLLLGSGLAVALIVTLVIAAALAGVGLLTEFGGARVTVITESPVTLVAGQTLDVQSEEPAVEATDVEDDEADDPADPHDGMTARGNEASSAPTAAPEPTPTATASPSPTPAVARVRQPATPTGPPRAIADVPIVMYHHIGPLPPNPDIYRKDLTVSPELFERTLARLAEQEVQTVTMDDLFDHFRGGPALPTRAAVLTFDDGYDDNYEYAFPMLKERGMVGTFYITTDFVGNPGYMTWEQIKEMADAGMEIAAHSANHADFAAISPNELRRQLVEPKAILEDHIKRPVRHLAYPAGKYNPQVIAASRAAGYESAVTVLHGLRHAPSQAFELRRVRARGADTAPEIVARMTPATWR